MENTTYFTNCKLQMCESKLLLTFITALLLILVFPTRGFAEPLDEDPDPVPYATLSQDGKTLTFSCGESMPHGAMAFPENDPSGLGSSAWMEYYETITTVEIEKKFYEYKPTSCDNWFAGLINLTTINGIEYINTSRVESMKLMFANCSSLKSVDLSTFNVEHVTSMLSMFSGCNSLTAVLAKDGWKITDKCDTTNMFSYSAALIRNDGQWKVAVDSYDGVVTTGNYKIVIDYNYFGIETDPVVIEYDDDYTLQVPERPGYKFLGWKQETMPGEFSDLITEEVVVPKGAGNRRYQAQWKEPYATLSQDGTTLQFFYGYEKPDDAMAFPDDDYPVWTGVREEFPDRGNITTVEIDKSFSEYEPTSCLGWFYDLSNLTTINGLDNLKTSQVTNMLLMFCGCASLETLDLSSFEVTNVEYFDYMFGGCVKLSAIIVNTNWTISESATSVGMFQDCYALMGGRGTMLDEEGKNTGAIYARIDGGTSNPGYFTTASDFEDEEIAITGDLKTKYLVGECKELNVDGDEITVTFGDRTTTKTIPMSSVKISGFEPEKIGEQTITVSYRGKTAEFTVTVLDVPYAVLDEDGTLTLYYDANRPTDKEVYDCPVDGSAPDWSNDSKIKKVVIDPSFKDWQPTMCINWFAGLTNLRIVEGLDNIDASKVTYVYGMFWACSSLQAILVSGEWNLPDNLGNGEGMFQDCYALMGGRGTMLDEEGKNTDASYARIDGGTSNPGYFTLASELEDEIIAITEPSKTEYIVGECEELNVDGGEITVTFGNGSNPKTIPMSSASISGFDPNTADEQTIIVSYRGKTKEFTVTVSEDTRKVVSIDVYSQGVALGAELKKLYFYVCYDDGSEDWVSFAAEGVKVEGLDIKQVGIYDVTVSYKGKNAQCTVEVFKEPIDFDFTNVNTKLNSNINEKPSGKVMVSYQTGESEDVDISEMYIGDFEEKDGHTQVYVEYHGYSEYLTVTFFDGPIPYAVLQGNTLTFYYKDAKDKPADAMDILNNDYPVWTGINEDFPDKENITTVSIDKSFSEYKPTSCLAWFAYLENLTAINGLEYINTSQVENMHLMFSDCRRLETLDLSNFDVTNVKNFDNMFSVCEKLSAIIVNTNWTISKSATGSSMFYACKALMGGKGTMLDKEGYNTGAIYARIDGGSSAPGYFTLADDFKKEKIEISKLPSKTDYFVGEEDELDVYGGKITVTLANNSDNSDNSTATISMDCATISGFNPNTADEQTIIVSYRGKTAEFTVTVLEDTRKVVSIDDFSAEIALGTKSDELYFYVNYDDGSGEWVSFAADDVIVEDLDIKTAGTYDNVKVIYKGVSGQGTVVIYRVPVSFDFSAVNTKDLNRNVNEKPSGMVTVSYETGESETVDIRKMDIGDYEEEDEITKVNVYYHGYSEYLTVSLVEGPTPYAVLDDNGTLTLYCSKELPEDEDSYFKCPLDGSTSGWSDNSEIKKVIIDLSFKDWQPTTCYRLFAYLSNLRIVEGLDNIDASKVTDVYGMFYNCYNLQAILVSDEWNLPADLDDGESMFAYCNALMGGKGSMLNKGENTDATYAHIDGGTDNPGYFTLTSDLEKEKIEITKPSKTEYIVGEDEYLSVYDGAITVTLADKSTATISMDRAEISGFDPNTVKKQTIIVSYRGKTAEFYVTVSEDTRKVVSFEEIPEEVELGTELEDIGFTVVYDDESREYLSFEDEDVIVEGFDTKTKGEQSVTITYRGESWTGKITVRITPTPYAMLDGETLTFKYAEEPEEGAMLFKRNDKDVYPWTAKSDNITNVVIDESFKDYMPYACWNWFAYLNKLTTIEGFENLNTSEVYDMEGMFHGCESLTTLDLSNFNTTNVEYMINMFNGCSLLETITVGSGWSTASIGENDENMFAGCTSLKGGLGTQYNEDNPTDATYAHIDGGIENPGYFSSTCDYSGFTIENGIATFPNGEEAIFISKDIKVTKVVIERSFTKDRPSTLTLPFSFDASKFSGGTFHTVTTVAYNDDSEQWEAKASDAVATVEANTPYLFKPSKTLDNITIEAAAGEYITLEANVFTSTFTNVGTYKDEDGKIVTSDWQLVGVYRKKVWEYRSPTDYGFAAKDMTNGIAAGEFVRAGKGAWINPMRCYLTYTGEEDLFEDYPDDAPHSKSATDPLPTTIRVIFPDATASVINPDDPTADPSGDIETPVSEIVPSHSAAAKVWSYDKTIYIEAQVGMAYQVIDLNGRPLIKGVTSTDREEVTLPRANSGIVIVRIGNKSYKIMY